MRAGAGWKIFRAANNDFQKLRGEGKIIPVLQPDGGQRENFHAARGFHGLLVHVLGRNEQRDGAAALLELFRDGETRKQMPARAAAGDGDEGRVGSG